MNRRRLLGERSFAGETGILTFPLGCGSGAYAIARWEFCEEHLLCVGGNRPTGQSMIRMTMLRSEVYSSSTTGSKSYCIRWFVTIRKSFQPPQVIPRCDGEYEWCGGRTAVHFDEDLVLFGSRGEDVRVPALRKVRFIAI